MTLYIHKILYYSILSKLENKKLVPYILKTIVFKNIKIKKKKPLFEDLNKQYLLARKYNKYIFILQTLDNYNGYELNYYELNRNTFVNLDYNLDKLFNINKNTELLKKSILEEHMVDINSRKVTNNLTKPHYFFTYLYNERSMPTQIKH